MIKISPRDAYLRLRILSRCLVDGPCDESMVRELSRYDTVGLTRRPKFRRSAVRDSHGLGRVSARVRFSGSTARQTLARREPQPTCARVRDPNEMGDTSDEEWEEVQWADGDVGNDVVYGAEMAPALSISRSTSGGGRDYGRPLGASLGSSVMRATTPRRASDDFEESCPHVTRWDALKPKTHTTPCPVVGTPEEALGRPREHARGR